MIHLRDFEGRIRRVVEGRTRIGEPSGEQQLRKIIDEIYKMGKDEADGFEYDCGYDDGYDDGFDKGYKQAKEEAEAKK